MNRAENFTIEKLDRSKVRRVDFEEFDRMAERAVSVPFESRADALTFLRFLVGHAFRRMTEMDDRHQTRAFFGKLASGDDFRASAKALARAEQLFAANDRGD